MQDLTPSPLVRDQKAHLPEDLNFDSHINNIVK